MDGSVFYLENKMRRKTWLTLSILILLGLGALMGAWDAHRAEAQVLETWVTATLLPGPMSGNLVRCRGYARQLLPGQRGRRAQYHFG